MQLTLFHGYPDYVGKRFIYLGSGKGPATYVTSGDPIVLPRYNNYIDNIIDAVTIGGAYAIKGIPLGLGPRANWVLQWSGVLGTVASLAIAGAGSAQTPGTYLVSATGGAGSGAVASIVVAAGGTVTAIPTIVNAGVGYTSAPTFTLAAGGTPATFTASLTVAGPVAAGTNLSGVTALVGGFGGVY